ncbi:hypothetical protein ACLMJK_001604 [Lecanora helva]
MYPIVDLDNGVSPYKPIQNKMHGSIVPRGPVPDDEVSKYMLIKGNHRSHRQPAVRSEVKRNRFINPPYAHNSYRNSQSTPELSSLTVLGPEVPPKSISKLSSRRQARYFPPLQPPQIPSRKTSRASRNLHHFTQQPSSETSSTSLPETTSIKFNRRRDYGTPSLHTALRSHAPTKEEMKHAAWLSEGWQLWSAERNATAPVVRRVQDERRERGGWRS